MSDNTYYFQNDNKVYRLTIEQDNDPIDPREWDNIGNMVCFSRRYNLGDSHNYSSPDDFLDTLLSDYDNELTIEQKIRKLERKGYCFLPISIYVHSGITMYVGGKYDHFDGQWDCSQVGWIYTTRETIHKEYGNIRQWKKRAKEILTAEVKEYDMYLTGDCYGYILEEYDPAAGDYEEIESVWGYLSDKWGIDLAKEIYGNFDEIDEEEADSITEEQTAEYEVMKQCDYIYAA